MTLVQILKLLLTASIFFSVFALAMRARAADLTYLAKHWRLGLGVVLAMYVAVPAVAIAMCLVFRLHPAVEIALIAMSLSPIPPVLPGKQMKVGGRACYVTSLLIAATMLSIIITPIGLEVVSRIFGVEADISSGRVAFVLSITVILPLLTGLLAGHLLKGSADAVAAFIRRAATLLLLAVALVLIIALLPAMWEVIGNGTLLALIGITVAGIVAGYLLGGPDPSDKAALALAAATRHPGVAVAIATINFPDQKLAPAAILLSLLLSSIISVPCLRIMARSRGEDVAIPLGSSSPSG